jgi:uncharacterized membrane-anchored protein
MDIGLFWDSAITIILGLALLVVRKVRRSRLVFVPILVVVYGIGMIFVHYLASRPTSHQLSPENWQTVVTTDGVFSVSMPAQPQLQTQVSQSESVPIKTVKQSISLDNGKYIFTMSEMHINDRQLEYDSRECVTGIAQDILSKSRGTLIDEKTIHLGTHEGKGLTIKVGDFYVIMKVFFIDHCAYQIKLTIPESQIKLPIVSKYFDSLTIDSVKAAN